MASSISDYTEIKILDAVFSHTTTGGGLPTADPYVALYTTAPTDAGGGTEVTGGSYARQQAAFAGAAAGATSNSANIDFTLMPACTVVAVGVFDAIAGNLMWWGDLTANKTVNSGDTFRIPAGDLDVTLN